MDYFKIFTIIFMIIMTYLMYKIYLEKCSKEGFEGTAQSLGGVDDTNAINTLAQIAKNLMTGGLTVPGNMTVPVVNLGGKFKMSGVGDFAANDEWLRMMGADGKNYYGGFAAGKLWTADGTINGRNIFAELDKLNSRWSGDNLTVAGHLTVNNGSDFNGGRHYFQDVEKAGRLRVGAAWGVPGIWGEDTGGLVQVSSFQIGSQRAGDNNTGGMVGDKWYDFIRSRNPSYGLLGPSNTGQLGMAWNNGRMYWTFLEKNQRNWNSDYGNLAN